MKKILSIALLLLILLTLVSCNDNTTITEKQVLDYISDYTDESTKDQLILKRNNIIYEYTSSKPELYVIKDGIGSINKIEQNHQVQDVTITVKTILSDGSTTTSSKDIKVAPIVYEDINDTPIATYFYTQAMGSYFMNSNHFKLDGDIFPELLRDNLDLIYYSFVMPRADGSLRIENPSYIEMVKDLKKDDVRVLFTIDGVSLRTSDAFKKVTENETNINNFVTNLMDLVDAYGFDGVDIDWEPFTGGTIPDQLDALMIALRAEMNVRQAEGGTPYILSAAVPGHRGTIEPWFNMNNLGEVVDYINFMNYNMQSSGSASHQTPVNGRYGVSTLIEYLETIDFPLNKVIVGSGSYGKAYQLDEIGIENPIGKKARGTSFPDLYNLGSFTSGTMYVGAIEALMTRDGYKEYHDYENGLLRGSYLYNRDLGIYVTYESITSATAKVDIIKEYEGMGIMTWAYSQDPNNYVVNALINARNS